MIQLLRKIPHEIIFVRHANCQLLKHYASRVPTKAATVLPDETTATPTPDPVASVAVPVQNLHTVDASKRVNAVAIEHVELPNPAAAAPAVVPFKVECAPQKLDSRLVSPNPKPIESIGELLDCYMKLAKFRLTSLVVITAMGGYAMAPAPFDLATFALCSLGTGLVSGAANSVNQFHEVPFDSQMVRTRNRVLCIGQLTPMHAIGFAAVSATAGLSMLYFGVNGLTAALGAGNLFLYTSIYTPMKRMSIANTWVGSVVGAIPPLMGWAACAGTLDAGAWILAGVLYAWQFPHFNALSWNLRPDYLKAGYRMMAVSHPDLCRRTTVRYTGVLVGLSFLAPALDLTNWWFALETLPLNAYFCYLAYKFYQKSDSGSSRKLFRFSLLHLPVLMLLLLFNKKHWIFAEAETEAATAAVAANEIALAEVTGTDALSVVEKASTLLQGSASSGLGKVLPLAVIAATPEIKQSDATLSASSPTSSVPVATAMLEKSL